MSDHDVAHASASTATLAYSRPLLIVMASLFGALVLVHLFRFWQTRTRAHGFLAVVLLLPIIEFALASAGRDATYLAPFATLLSIMVPIMLLAIWTRSMRDRVASTNATIVRVCTYTCFTFLFIAAVMMTVANGYVSQHGSEDVPGRFDIVWLVGVGLHMAGMAQLLGASVWLQFAIVDDSFSGRNTKRLQILRLSAIFSLYLLAAIGHLTVLTALYVAPYFLANILLVLTRHAITGFEFTPEESIQRGRTQTQSTYEKPPVSPRSVNSRKLSQVTVCLSSPPSSPLSANFSDIA
ncbi:hypothetical protein THASP1DRAFT_30401 [Thamnocephalis sphaerospora]|uniref:Integral membrane protein n=1 Tax=Thamnocephalis sphaerospora TaxID=78915 RepID=A0A4P9XP60_9FUNG|nr:hypothetical protein THASP1DRAFT_30401 [Thamnocephalis sphaerospora]|eukprot:RKP07783.1 hypothetical protein THASP1DRAFT_30401 [Thamnocephalis sphaerospora]